MILLVLGVIIWSLIHFVPASAVGLRTTLVNKLGPSAYKGLFALLVIGSLLMMVFGWKAVQIDWLYTPPQWGPYLTAAGVLLSSFLFFAPYIPNSLSRKLRHPQLAGVVVFGLAHLFSNGESRSIVLFGGLAAWAFLEILLLNRRDGSWTKPAANSPVFNIRLLFAGLAFFALLAYAHPWLFGVSPVP